jgi:hypothetical protein
MPGIADKFTQSAQSRLLWPGMMRLDSVRNPQTAFECEYVVPIPPMRYTAQTRIDLFATPAHISRGNRP